MYTRPMFRKVKQFIPENVASTTAEYHSVIASSDLDFNSANFGANFDCTIKATTGNVTIGFSTSITSTQGYILQEGSKVDIKVPSEIYICSNSTTAAFQAIIWE